MGSSDFRSRVHHAPTTAAEAKRFFLPLGILFLIFSDARAENCKSYLPDPASFPFSIAANIRTTTITTERGGAKSTTWETHRGVRQVINPHEVASRAFGSGSGLPQQVFAICDGSPYAGSSSRSYPGGDSITTYTAIVANAVLNLMVLEKNRQPATAASPCTAEASCEFVDSDFKAVYVYQVSTGAYKLNIIGNRHERWKDASRGITHEDITMESGEATGTWPLLQADQIKLRLEPEHATVRPTLSLGSAVNLLPIKVAVEGAEGQPMTGVTVQFSAKAG